MKVVILIATMLTACAKPNYVNAQTNPPPRGKGDACEIRFEVSKDCMSLTWEKMPGERTLGTFLVKVYRLSAADNGAILQDPLGSVDVSLEMPSMGHGSNAPIVVDRLDIGTYRVGGVIFSMHGPWEIHVLVKHGNTVRDKAIVPFTF